MARSGPPGRVGVGPSSTSDPRRISDRAEASALTRSPSYPRFPPRCGVRKTLGKRPSPWRGWSPSRSRWVSAFAFTRSCDDAGGCRSVDAGGRLASRRRIISAICSGPCPWWAVPDPRGARDSRRPRHDRLATLGMACKIASRFGSPCLRSPASRRLGASACPPGVWSGSSRAAAPADSTVFAGVGRDRPRGATCLAFMRVHASSRPGVVVFGVVSLFCRSHLAGIRRSRPCPGPTAHRAERSRGSRIDPSHVCTGRLASGTSFLATFLRSWPGRRSGSRSLWPVPGRCSARRAVASTLLDDRRSTYRHNRVCGSRATSSWRWCRPAVICLASLRRCSPHSVWAVPSW